MTKDLEDGFYWVHTKAAIPFEARWEVAHLCRGGWWLAGDDGRWSSDDFAEIDPRPIKREAA